MPTKPTKAKSKSTSARKPWEKPAPRGAGHAKLTKAKKAKAKASAKRAGRPYPNLVDNMRAASAGKRKKRAKKS